MSKLKIVIHSDGKCAPNPGTGSTGFIISSVDLNFRVFGAAKLRGKWSSAATEYAAMVQAVRVLRVMLQKVGADPAACDVLVRTDSQMIAHQNTVDSRTKLIYRSVNKRNAWLRHRLLDEAEVMPVGQISIEHVLRKYNTAADELTNFAHDAMAYGEGIMWVVPALTYPDTNTLNTAPRHDISFITKI